MLGIKNSRQPQLDCEHHSAACRGRSVTLVGAGGWWPDPQLDWEEIDEAGGVIRLSPARSKTLVGRILPISPPIAVAPAEVTRSAEILPARDSVGQTSGATQRCLNPEFSERIGNSRRTGARLDGAPGAHRAPARAASTDCAGVCDRTRQHDRGEEAADVKADGGPLAAAVYRQGRRWAARRTAAGCPSDDQRYAGGSRRNSDVGNDTARRDPLEHAHAGEGHGRQSDACASHLAGVRTAAASHEELQAVA